MDIAFPPRDETLDFFRRLNVEKYQNIGAPENHGVYVDNEGLAVWIQEYLRFRVNGDDHIPAAVKVFEEIDAIRASQLPRPPITGPLTRDQICSVHTSFQGLRGNIPGYGEIPLFGPFCFALDAVGRRSWRSTELAAGDTHCIRALSVEYANDNGYSYPVRGVDFTNDLTSLKQRLAEDLDAGLIPFLYLAGDGQQHSADGGTYGWRWLMDNMPRIIAALQDPTIYGFNFTEHGGYVHGFELITNGGWSPSNFEDAVLKLRSLIGDGVIASHIGTYTWWGDANPADKHGSVGDWSDPAGQAIDVCFEEGDTPFVDDAGNLLNNGNSDGWEQRAWAHLGPAVATNIQPKNRVAYEWPSSDTQTPRGRRYAVALEIDAYRWVRNLVTLDEVNRERAAIRNLGFTLVG